jgi:hypothetical protein
MYWISYITFSDHGPHEEIRALAGVSSVPYGQAFIILLMFHFVLLGAYGIGPLEHRDRGFESR